MEPTLIGAIIGILIGTIFNAIVLWIVGKLGIGITIEKFGTAFVAALIIAVIGVLTANLTKGMEGAMGKFGGTVLHIVFSAAIILLVDKIMPGMKAKGFLGAVIAAIAIGVVQWLLGSVVAGLSS